MNHSSQKEGDASTCLHSDWFAARNLYLVFKTWIIKSSIIRTHTANAGRNTKLTAIEKMFPGVGSIIGSPGAVVV